MAITPEGLNIPEITDPDIVPMPLRTYELDFVNGQLTGRIIDGRDAVIQSAMKVIMTERYKYPIYGFGYGNELWTLLGEDATEELAQTETERFITEAIMTVDYIESVSYVDTEKINDRLLIKVGIVISSVIDSSGIINLEVEV